MVCADIKNKKDLCKYIVCFKQHIPLGEVARRSDFTKQYKSWGAGLIEKTGRRRDEECGKRSTFHDQLHGHFLTTLFRGDLS